MRSQCVRLRVSEYATASDAVRLLYSGEGGPRWRKEGG